MSDDTAKFDELPKVIEDSADKPLTKEEEQEDKAAKDLGNESATNQFSMEVKVGGPFNTYFEGSAFSITGENDTGIFDILPKHHNFMSLLKPCTLVVRTVKGDEQKINISGGLMHVKADKVVVFLDI